MRRWSMTGTAAGIRTLVIALVVVGASSAWAQSDADSTATTSSLPDSALAMALGYRFAPSYLNLIDGTFSSVSMRNGFQGNLLTPFGGIFNMQASKEKEGVPVAGSFRR